MSNYQKSEEHKANAALARKLAVISSQNKKLERIEKYNSDPRLCITCQNPISYDKKANKFCSKSCSAKLNNLSRVRTEETNNKTSSSLKQFYSQNPKLKIKSIRTKIKIKSSRTLNCDHCKKEFTTLHTNKKFCSRTCNKISSNLIKKEFIIICKVCNKEVTVLSRDKRKTCSRECQIHASIHVRPYINGSRANHYYFNKNENKTILLESSWEVKVAERLDELNINWIRPKPIKWIDEDNKNRLYYPDFYLPKYNLYLDPKNPYAQKIGKYKLECVSKIVNLKFGLLPEILDYIETLDKIDI